MAGPGALHGTLPVVRLENLQPEDFRALARGRLHSLEAKLAEWDGHEDPYGEETNITHWDSRTHVLAFTFVGSGFFYHMVRRIVSTFEKSVKMTKTATPEVVVVLSL